MISFDRILGVYFFIGICLYNVRLASENKGKKIEADDKIFQQKPSQHVQWKKKCQKKDVSSLDLLSLTKKLYLMEDVNIAYYYSNNRVIN